MRRPSRGANHRGNHARHVLQRHAGRIDHQIVLGRLHRGIAEEVSREKLAGAVHFQAACAGLLRGTSLPAVPCAGRASLAGATSRKWKTLGVSPKRCRAPRPTSTTLPRSAAWRGRLGQAVQIFLVRRVQAEAVGHGDGLFVEPLQFGVRHVLDLGRLMEQFAVEQFPAEGLGKFPGDFTAAGAVLAGDGDDVHANRLTSRSVRPCVHGRPAYKKTGPTRKCSWRGLDTSPIVGLPEDILKVGVISVGNGRRGFMANPIAIFSILRAVYSAVTPQGSSVLVDSS